MALTKKDLLEFGETLKRDLAQSLLYMWRADLRVALNQQTQDITRDIRDEMSARFTASEQKFDRKIDHLRTELAETVRNLMRLRER